MDNAATTLAQLISALDAPAMLSLFIIGLLRGWWVMGATHVDVKGQRDKLLEIVLTNVQLLKEATEELKKRGGGTRGRGA